MSIYRISFDLHGEWVVNPTSYTLRLKDRETVPIKISENVPYNEFVEIIIFRFDLNCGKDDLSIIYIFGFIKKQKGAPSRIRNDSDL